MKRTSKSPKEKHISGTSRDDRERRTKNGDGDPSLMEPEFELSEFGLHVYNQLITYLNKNGILFDVDNMLISQYAYFSQIFKTTTDKMGNDYTKIVATSDKGNSYMAVEYQVLTNAKNQMSALAKILGIGPYYRQYIKAFDEEPEGEDEIADYIKKMNK